MSNKVQKRQFSRCYPSNKSKPLPQNLVTRDAGLSKRPPFCSSSRPVLRPFPSRHIDLACVHEKDLQKLVFPGPQAAPFPLFKALKLGLVVPDNMMCFPIFPPILNPRFASLLNCGVQTPPPSPCADLTLRVFCKNKYVRHFGHSMCSG